jgi:hypothetical protein
MKEKNRIGEKVEEWEMKGHACWPSPYPQLSLFIPLFSLSKGFLLAKRGGCIESQELHCTRDC